MKTMLLFVLTAFCFRSAPASLYDLKFASLEEGKDISLSQFRGKKLLIVNTACRSPYTFQMAGLQQLYSAYKEKLVVIGLPAGSDFGDQELATNKDIRNFCTNTYGITFPMSEKTSVKGVEQHPVFQQLIAQAKEMGMSEPVIKWNFTKFLVDEEGKLVKVFPADITPLSTEITSYLNNSRNWSLN